MAGKSLQAVVSLAGVLDPSVAKSIQGASGNLEKLNKKSLITGAALAGIGVAAATAAIKGAKYLVDLGSKFEGVTHSIRTSTGKTGASLDGLVKDFDEVYKKVPADMDVVSASISGYNKMLDLTGKPLQDLAQQSSEVSNMLGVDVAGVVDSSSKAFKQWNLSADQMTGAMDTVWKVSQSTGDGFTDLLDTVQKFGPQLQDMGFSFGDATAMIGQLNKSGVNTDEVMAAMKKSVGAFAKEGLSASAGIEKYSNAIKNAKNSTEAVTIASKVFGAKAGSTMAAAIRNGTLNIDDFTKSLANNKETILGAADDTLTFGDRLTIFKHNAAEALKPASKTLFDALGKALPVVTDALQKVAPKIGELASKFADLAAKGISKVVDFLPKLIDFLPKVIDAVSWMFDHGDAVVGIIGGIAAAIAAIKIASLVGNIKKIITSIKGVSSAMGLLSSGGIGLIIIAVIAAVAAFKYLWDHCEGFRNFWIGLWNGIKAVFGAIWNFITTAIKTGVAIWHAIVNGVVGFFTGAWNAIQAAFSAVWNFIVAYIQFWYNTVSTIVSGVVGFFTNAWSLIRSGASAFLSFMLGLPQKIINGFAIIGTGIANFFKTGINAVITVINGFIGALNHIKLPDFLGGYGINIPLIPYLATGGFTEGLSFAGEAGQEAVLSFDSRYRAANLGYWAKAGSMLGVADESTLLGMTGSQSMVYNMGGFSFAPVITAAPGMTFDDLLNMIESASDEFIDRFEAMMIRRERGKYGAVWKPRRGPRVPY